MKPKLLFVHENERTVKDGLWAALRLLESDFTITRMHVQDDVRYAAHTADLVLGWGAFGSRVDAVVSTLPRKKGLCIGGTAGSPTTIHSYQVVFYETYWDLTERLEQTGHLHLVHAFGVNTDIYQPIPMEKLVDWLTVGAFALWKRQPLLGQKSGVRLAIGQIQKDNLGESYEIITKLLKTGCGVMDMVSEEALARFYNASKTVYIPAELHGGGERAILEARACGIPVEIAGDNPKTFELATMDEVWDHHYYYQQLKHGLTSLL
jgi:hypothetical protein